MHDPTVHWGLNNVGRIRWSDLEAIDSKGVLEEARNFGIMSGVAISVLISESRSIASFARADREYDEDEMAQFERDLGRLHLATIDVAELSKRDRQALTDLSIKLTH